MKLAWTIGIVTVSLLTAACSGTPTSPTRSFNYTVSGSGTTRASLITYQASAGALSQVSDIALPWNFTRNAKGGEVLVVTAQNAEPQGCITAEIRSGNQTLQTATSCGAFVVVVASGVVP